MSAPSSKMSLANVKRGVVETPFTMVVYGSEGVGKSSFAARMPNPIFLGAEAGTSQLDVARFPLATSWSDITSALKQLEIGEHSFETLVIDTLDSIERLCWEHVCETVPTESKTRARSIEDYGYGKGPRHALKEWQALIERFDQLIEKRRMNICLIGHSTLRKAKQGTLIATDEFKSIDLNINEWAASAVKQWANAVLFCAFETLTSKSKGEQTVRAHTTGVRVLHTASSGAWEAKSRYSLPPTMPLDWAAVDAAMREPAPARCARLLADIDRQLVGHADGTRTNVLKFVESVKTDPRRLEQALNKLLTMEKPANQDTQETQEKAS